MDSTTPPLASPSLIRPIALCIRPDMPHGCVNFGPKARALSYEVRQFETV